MSYLRWISKLHSILPSGPELANIGIFGYLGSLVENYFSKKSLRYEADEDPKEKGNRIRADHLQTGTLKTWLRAQKLGDIVYEKLNGFS